MYRVSKSKREIKESVKEEKIAQFKTIFKNVFRQSTVDSVRHFFCK